METGSVVLREALEEVESFTYLGSMIDKQGGNRYRREGENWQGMDSFPHAEVGWDSSAFMRISVEHKLKSVVDDDHFR